jgi:hypothetical protein
LDDGDPAQVDVPGEAADQDDLGGSGHGRAERRGLAGAEVHGRAGRPGQQHQAGERAGDAGQCGRLGPTARQEPLEERDHRNVERGDEGGGAARNGLEPVGLQPVAEEERRADQCPGGGLAPGRSA